MAEPIDGRTRLGGLGAIATAVALTGTAGVPGAIAGLAVLLTWVLTVDVVAFAVATVAVGALLSAESFVVLGPEVADAVPAVGPVADFFGVAVRDLLALAAIAVAMIPLTLGSASGTNRPVVVGLLTLVLTAGLATLAMTPILAGESVLVGGVTLAAVVATVAYGLHRYGLLVSGVLQHG